MRATTRGGLSVATVVLALLLGACATGPATQAESNATVDAEQQPNADVYLYALGQAFKQISAGEIEEAYPALTGVIHSPVFDRLDSKDRHSALLVAGLIAIDLDKAAEAHTLLVRASAMPEADGEDWLGRLHAAHLVNERDDAVLSLTQLSRWPAKVQELNHRIVLDTVGHARARTNATALYALLDSLYVAKWKLPYDMEPSYLWRDLAALELDRRQLARAQEVISRVQSPHVVIGMRIDRRFDPVRESVPQYFDVDASVVGELREMRAIVQRSPRSLDAIVQLTYSMLAAGLYDETLQLTADVMRTIDAAPNEEPPYDDMDAVIWILDNRARALAATQRWSEAEEQVRAAANREENGTRNVSNVINLAWFYANAGRSDEALAALLDLGQDMSPYGLMQMHGVRHAAAVQKDDAMIADESFKYLQQHRDDALEMWQWTLVHANRLDEAAQLIIERLRDPVLRGAVLEELQNYANPPPPAAQAVWNARWTQIKNRTDVRSAIDAVGRIESFRIPQPVT